MADGPQRSRLDTALDTADVGGVTGAGTEWLRCATLLGEVAKALDNAAEMDVRGSTGTSMKGAFTRSATSVREKIERLDQGRQALLDAHTAIVTARQDRIALDADNPGMSAPADFRPDPEKTAEENQTAKGLQQGAVNDYWDRYAKREAEARRIADILDTKYADSVEVMKKIHGEPDIIIEEPKRQKGTVTRPKNPRSPLARPGTVDPPAHRDPAREWEPTEPRHHDPTDPTDPTYATDPTDPRNPHDPVDPDLPPIPGNPDRFDPVSTGGLAIGGGLGLAGLTNAIRGGLAVPGQAVRAAGPVRPIGSTSRAAVSGALGRSGAMGTGSPTTGRGAGARAGGAGGTRGAAGRGVGAAGSGQAGRNQGGRGAGARGAGGRGAGASGIAGGRRGNARDEEEKASDRDLFDDGQDWIAGDEGASPVLD